MCVTVTQIKDKINKHAFSGGKDTMELQRELGADLSKDVSYEWYVHTNSLIMENTATSTVLLKRHPPWLRSID